MKYVILEENNAVATLTLKNGDGNRINFQMREEVLRSIDQVSSGSARALVVKAEGKDFCLGGDVTQWPDLPLEELRPKIEVFAYALDHLAKLAIPTIAEVQGGCAGGGFELALACDFIIAGRSAHFFFPEALFGIMTLQGGVYTLADRIGRTKALEVALLSEHVSADQLAQWNVVSRVVEDGDLERETLKLAARLATGPAKAFAAVKDLLRVWEKKGIPGAREALYDISMPLFMTEDTHAALSAAAAAVKAGKPMPHPSFPHGVHD